MKKKAKFLIAGAVVLIILGFVFNLVNSFTGNPVSALIASRKIRAYAETTYPALDLELSKASYNFKNNAYGIRAKSKKSIDTNFYIWYSHGKVSDDYKYEVANHFTTYRRLNKDFNSLVKSILDKEFPYKTTLVVSDLSGDTNLLAPDMPLDLDNMPLDLSLSVYAICETRNDEKFASMLIELQNILLNKGIRINKYSIRLEEPLPETSKPGSGNNLYLIDFPAKKISNNNESLVTTIKQHRSLMESKDNKY